MKLYGGGTIRGDATTRKVFGAFGFIHTGDDHFYIEGGTDETEKFLNAIAGVPEDIGSLEALDLYLEDNDIHAEDPRKFRVVLHEGTIHVIDAVAVYLLPPDAEMLKKQLWGEGGKRVLEQLEL